MTVYLATIFNPGCDEEDPARVGGRRGSVDGHQRDLLAQGVAASQHRQTHGGHHAGKQVCHEFDFHLATIYQTF